MTPKTLADTGFIEAVGGRALIPNERIGTCTAATPPSTLDYIVADTRICPIFQRLRIKLNGVTTPHRPVQIGWPVAACGQKVDMRV
eukprot:12190343-Karenia_brevis.AAC.1